MADTNIYSTSNVKALFDEMAETYGFVNLVSSFGFAERWRRQCVQQIEIIEDAQVCDLMSGMGETWPTIFESLGSQGKITAVDLSSVMCTKAKASPAYRQNDNVEVLEENVLENSLPDESFDYVISSFGLKTFSTEQLGLLSKEINRILKPGGQFSLVEISVPSNPILQWFYRFYLNFCIPIIGKLFLGNPDNYRMLWRYTEAFGDCRKTASILQTAGLQVQYLEFFFGCASGLYGYKRQ
ncbi:MAG: methyltransferase domain-containing protein [Chloroflexi bacterium]|nr:MAG: methyltransferase domain-containing protein [Chloroflexota bacterium]MBL1196316.1 methyltransferase domain-containing protein [Chloroflexota bacterium]NOH13611.1 class I SAM-dependent methyltransferase [Chloroflexota bacterium]